ncbi:DUF6442 family protein [Paenisporosarcina antarctica]|uniref:Uncharacterized protein n=1 Tax=Paenisporosarcina antarctica TaxID=417367 RepID=A0A4P7A399_9BACL|nr:DUF6442 family protein [Paenisporosarcina antarctica]QBP43198.1 hypothetical protein E2636_18775 [Paenisporosarcina antarctica]
MNKNEILAKSRKDNKYMDERDEKIDSESGLFGFTGITILKTFSILNDLNGVAGVLTMGGSAAATLPIIPCMHRSARCLDFSS